MRHRLLTAFNGGGALTGTLIEDAFTDTNGTNITAHTIAPTNTPATSWTTTLAGGTTIQSNKAQTANSTSHVDLVDAGRANVTITVDLTNNGQGYNGLSMRSIDMNNRWLVRWRNGEGLQIVDVQAGVGTQRAVATPTGSISAYSLAVTANGDTISATVNGTTATYASATFQNTVTKHGLYGGEFGDTHDNFKVVAI